MLAQLSTPTVRARTVAGSTRTQWALTNGAYRVSLRITPNRASAHDTIALRLARHDRPVDGATVTVTYSMPAMNMWDAFTGSLPQTGGGAYRAREPVFGMAGAWQLRFRIVPNDGAPFTVRVADRMVG